MPSSSVIRTAFAGKCDPKPACIANPLRDRIPSNKLVFLRCINVELCGGSECCGPNEKCSPVEEEQISFSNVCLIKEFSVS